MRGHVALTGVWLAGSNVAEPARRRPLCACVPPPLKTNGGASLDSGRVSRRLTAHCSRSVPPRTRHLRPCTRSLSACSSEGGLRSGERDRERDAFERRTFRTEVRRLMVGRPRFSGSKKQVALGDSLHLSKIQSME